MKNIYYITHLAIRIFVVHPLNVPAMKTVFPPCSHRNTVGTIFLSSAPLPAKPGPDEPAAPGDSLRPPRLELQ